LLQKIKGNDTGKLPLISKAEKAQNKVVMPVGSFVSKLER
jgi:hypothetical protein